MPTPVEVRRIRIDCLIIFAKKLLEAGVPSHLLVDRLEQASFRLWPGLREETRKSYVRSALRMVLSRPTASADVLPQEMRQASPQEAI